MKSKEARNPHSPTLLYIYLVGKICMKGTTNLNKNREAILEIENNFPLITISHFILWERLLARLIHAGCEEDLCYLNSSY